MNLLISNKLSPPPAKPWAFILGRICLTTCRQAANAPFIDDCTVSAGSRGIFRGLAILLAPWRRKGRGKTLPQPAIVIAWLRAADLPRQKLEKEIEDLRTRIVIAELESEVFRDLSRCLVKKMRELMAERAAMERGSPNFEEGGRN